MAREKLEFDVTARDVNTRKTFDGIADSADHSRQKFDELGKQSRHLDAEILRLEKSTRDLAAGFRSTEDIELFKRFRKDQSTLNQLRKMRTELLQVGETAATVGVTGGRNALGGFTDAFGALPSEVSLIVMGAGVAAAATTAPIVGAMIGGAILAGVGTVGIGAGVALAFQDPRVQGAAQDLGMRVKTSFTDAASAFVAPTAAALGILGDAASDVGREAHDAFDGLAPEVVPLAHAIGDMARNGMPGFKDAVEAARPGLRVMNEELPQLGDAFSDMFTSISEEGDGAILGLVALFDLAEFAIRNVGDSIAFLSARYEDSVRAGAAFTGAMEDILGWVPVVGDAFRNSNDRAEGMLSTLDKANGPSQTAIEAFRGVSRATDDAGASAANAVTDFNALFGQWIAVDQSAIQAQDALRAVKESVDKNGTSLDIMTEKGARNADMLVNGAEAAKRHEQALIRNGSSAAGAAAETYNLLMQLRANAIAAGMSATEVDKLLGKYIDFSKAPNITKTITYKEVWTSSGKASAPKGGGGHAFMSKGGLIEGRGTGTSDDIVSRLSNGEYVVTASAARAVGVPFLDAINQMDNPARVRRPASVPAAGPAVASDAEPRWFRPALAAAMRDAMAGATLRIDDRTARFADLIRRAG